MRSASADLRESTTHVESFGAQASFVLLYNLRAIFLAVHDDTFVACLFGLTPRNLHHSPPEG
jgi:hypothetical protein